MCITSKEMAGLVNISFANIKKWVIAFKEGD